MHDVVSTELDADLARLQSGIRQLKIQYDMFFAGSIPRQPFELRGEIEKIIRRYSSTPIQKYAPRFHFNSLVSRFNSLSELWAKTIRALEEGVGSIVDIDTSMKLGLGYPMGPFTLGDFVGLDTTYYIAEIMFNEFREKRFAPPPLLKRMVMAGLYGRKSGRGFYDYTTDPKNPTPMKLI